MSAAPDKFPAASLGQHLFDLAQQVAIALGEAASPLDGSRDQNLPAARYLIDVIAMLESKTQGNRTPEEDTALTGMLAQLKMAYVKKASGAA